MGLVEGYASQPRRLQDGAEKRDYFDTDQAIHRRIAELSGNRVLAMDYAGHANKIRRAMPKPEAAPRLAHVRGGS